MDEKQLAELFRDAVRDAPPATFDESDVAGAARRADARRRSLVVGGSTLAVVLLAVGLVIGFLDLGHTGGKGMTTAEPAATSAPPRQQFNAETGPGRAKAGTVNGTEGNTTVFPGSSPTQGGGKPGKVGSDAGTAPGGCGPADGELADALAGELPSAGVTSPAPAPLTCPAGSRAASYQVHSGSATGRVSVVLAPAGRFPVTPAGAAAGTARTATGRQLTVLTQPAAGSPAAPLTTGVAGLAQRLAPKF